MAPVPPEQMRFRRTAEFWAAISVSGLLIGLSVFILFTPSEVLPAVILLVLGFLMLDSLLRGTYAREINRVAVILALISVVVLVVEFWKEAIVGVLCGFALFLILQRVREFRGPDGGARRRACGGAATAAAPNSTTSSGARSASPTAAAATPATRASTVSAPPASNVCTTIRPASRLGASSAITAWAEDGSVRAPSTSVPAPLSATVAAPTASTTIQAALTSGSSARRSGRRSRRP